MFMTLAATIKPLIKVFKLIKVFMTLASTINQSLYDASVYH